MKNETKNQEAECQLPVSDCSALDDNDDFLDSIKWMEIVKEHHSK